jgi:hypothetical protein
MCTIAYFELRHRLCDARPLPFVSLARPCEAAKQRTSINIDDQLEALSSWTSGSNQ